MITHQGGIHFTIDNLRCFSGILLGWISQYILLSERTSRQCTLLRGPNLCFKACCRGKSISKVVIPNGAECREIDDMPSFDN